MFCLKVLSLFLLIGSVLSWTAPKYDLENAEQHFADFIKKYNRRYESYEEYKKRLEIFKKKLKRVNELNEKYSTEHGGYDISRFDDQEHFPSCVDISRMINNTEAIEVKREFIINAPDRLDYREQGLVTEVKDQGNCGSCFIFAAIGSIEGMSAKQSGSPKSLSEQQVIDCLPNDCNTAGDPLNAMNFYAQEGGCMTEADYPYTGQPGGECRFDKSKVAVKVTGGTSLSTPDPESMKGALYQAGAPIATLLYASNDFRQARGKTVVNPSDCNNQDPDHAITLVGYDKDESGKNYWIIKNSWGAGVGDGGYFYLDMENKCSFGRFTSAATVA